MKIPYNLIITVIILHELSHAFTKYYFNHIVTPLGVGYKQGSSYGESGYLVEDEIVGGRLSVLWKHEKDWSNMTKIHQVAIVRGSQKLVVGEISNFLMWP
jgi:hypothetical protein